MTIHYVQLLETEIAYHILRVLLEDGYTLKINDGKHTYSPKQSPTFLLSCMFKTDEDIIIASKPDIADKYIHLIYGNDGWRVIHDYTATLDSVLYPVLDAIANKRLQLHLSVRYEYAAPF